VHVSRGVDSNTQNLKNSVVTGTRRTFPVLEVVSQHRLAVARNASTVGFAVVSSLPMRDGNFVRGTPGSTSSMRFEPTYEGWKLSIPPPLVSSAAPFRAYL